MSSENTNATPESAAADLGGLEIPLPTPSGINSAANPDSAAEAVIRTKRKYTKRDSNASGQVAKGGIPALSFEQFKHLYSPELWGQIAAAPADAAAALTGKEYWKISDAEKKNMGEPLSIVAQLYSTADPRYIALIAALITVGSAYSSRVAKAIAEAKAKKQSETNKTA